MHIKNMVNQLTIDVVIPSYKPDEKLKDIFEKLSNQTVSINKIIVMNTEKKYWDELINGKEYEKVEVHHISADEFDHGMTRNQGISYSNADIVVLMTQDAVPYDNKLIEAFVSALSVDEKIGAAYARQLARDDSSLDEKFTRGFNYPDVERVKSRSDIATLGIKAFFCSNVCAAYKKNIFDELGGFVNEAIFNEDMVYAHKLLMNDYYIKYEPKAMVYHTHEYSGMQQYKRNFDLAVSQAMHPEVFSGVSSESEGVRYVMAAFKYFLRKGRPFRIIPFGIKCVYKLAGYKKGKSFENMTKDDILKATSNVRFFNKYFSKI